MASTWQTAQIPSKQLVTARNKVGVVLACFLLLIDATPTAAVDCATISWDSRTRVCEARLLRRGAAGELPALIAAQCPGGSTLIMELPDNSAYHAFVLKLCASAPTHLGDTFFRCKLRPGV